MSPEDETDFEFESEAPSESFDIGTTKSARGMVVNKSKLSNITGLAIVTLDRMFAEGAPIIAKGTRKQGWQINTADFIGWYVRHKVAEVTDDPDAGSYDIAERQSLEAQTRLRELEIAKKEGELVPVDEVVAFISNKFGVVRSRFLAVESQVPGLNHDQRDALKSALADAFADVSSDKREDWTDDNDDDADSEEIDSERSSEA